MTRINNAPAQDDGESIAQPTIHLTGHIASYHEVTTDYTILDNDGYSVILVDSGASAMTVTLPALANNLNRTIFIARKTTSAGSVTVDGSGAETIEGNANETLGNKKGSLYYAASATDWIKLGGN